MSRHCKCCEHYTPRMTRQRRREIALLMAYEMRRRAIELSQLRTEREGATDGLR